MDSFILFSTENFEIRKCKQSSLEVSNTNSFSIVNISSQLSNKRLFRAFWSELKQSLLLSDKAESIPFHSFLHYFLSLSSSSLSSCLYVSPKGIYCVFPISLPFSPLFSPSLFFFYLFSSPLLLSSLPASMYPFVISFLISFWNRFHFVNLVCCDSLCRPHWSIIHRFTEVCLPLLPEC